MTLRGGLGAAAWLGLLACPPAPAPEPEPGTWGSVPLPEAECVGDGDGVIEPGELVVALDAGIHARFLVNGSVGAAPDLGEPPWDLAPPVRGDDLELRMSPAPVSGYWFADRFPGGEFVSLLDHATGTLGVYAWDEGLVLLGIASTEPDETALRYTPPVPVLPVPLRVGDSWTVDAAAEGVADGEPFPQDLGVDGVVSLRHRYELTADAFGDAHLPAATVPVLRLRLQLRSEARNSIAGLFAADLSHARLYVAECLGVVARVRSLTDELDPDFSQATELLRFGLAQELEP